MEAIFLKLLQMSITASWLIVAVIILRLLLKKAPKNYFCILWGIVALRLICPFSIESIVGVVPNLSIFQENLSEESGIEVNENGNLQGNRNDVQADGFNEYADSNEETNFNENVNSNEEVKSPDTLVVKREESQIDTTAQSTKIPIKWIVPYVWIIGMVILFLYSIVGVAKLRFKVSVSLPIEKHIYICDNIHSPFILGILNPKIYVPSDLSEEQMVCVVSHEQMHLKRFDHYWKPIGFLLLTVYWFNPFVWIAYVLFCRDMELACDEQVIRKMSRNEKIFYAQTLIFCSSGQRRNLAYPLAFGETGIKERVKFMVHYKKPNLQRMIIASIICLTVVGCFGTNSSFHTMETGEQNEDTENTIGDASFVFEENEDGTYTVVEVLSETLAKDIVIPSTYDGKSVTKIGDYAFMESDVRSIEIPSSVTSIGELAFAYCEELERVKMEDSVTSIGRSAFYGCISLKEVELSSNLTVLEDLTFASCTSLILIEIPSSVTSIGDRAFSYTNCAVIVPSSVTSIGKYAFVGVNNIDVVVLAEAKSKPEGWDEKWCGNNSNVCWDAKKHTIVKQEAVSATCIKSGLTEGVYCSKCNQQFVKQKEVLSKGGHNFSNGVCKNCNVPLGELEYVENEDGTYTVAGIGTYSDISVVIPIRYNGKRVTGIAAGAFEGVESLQSVKIPYGVEFIGKHAFGNIENDFIIVETVVQSKPENWDEEWIGKNVTVEWGGFN